MNPKEALETIWDYLCLPNDVGVVDAILVLGSYDLAVPAYAAKLFHEGVAPVMIVSGSGTTHKDDPLWEPFHGEPEADMFARILQEHGVPASAIHIENESQNTGENFHFTRNMLERNGEQFLSMRIVTKPYMMRRALATALVAWPAIQWSVASEGGTAEMHLARAAHPERVIDLMVGDLDRIMAYPKLGFSVPQEVPDNVREAFEVLVRAGHTRCLVSGAI